MLKAEGAGAGSVSRETSGRPGAARPGVGVPFSRPARAGRVPRRPSDRLVARLRPCPFRHQPPAPRVHAALPAASPASAHRPSFRMFHVKHLARRPRPSLARFRRSGFLVRMFHVKHSLALQDPLVPGRVRARRAARDGEKASNSEEGARLRRPRRAVAEARLPSTRRYAEEGFPARPEPGAKLPNSMVSCHGEPLPPSSRPRRGLGGRHPAEKSSGEGATSGPVAVGLTAGLRKERTTWPFPPVKTQKARRRGYATRFRG